jgi:hypothetical protein
MRDRATVFSSELRGVIRRLSESSSRRIARRNANRELDSFLAKIRRELRSEFPNYSKSGAEVLIGGSVLPDGQKSCPFCSAYMGTYRKLAAHLLDKHGNSCACGYLSKSVRRAIGRGAVIDRKLAPALQNTRSQFPPSKFGTDQMTSHLRNLKDDLRTHLLMGAMGGEA